MLAKRTPTQVNSTLATQRSLQGAHVVGSSPKKGNDKAEKGLGMQTRKKSAAGDAAPVRSQDPFADNFELKNVGRMRLLQCSVPELCAALKSRLIAHAANVQASQCVSKLEAWKRERAISKRDSECSSSVGGSKSRQTHKETHDDDDMSAPEGAPAHAVPLHNKPLHNKKSSLGKGTEAPPVPMAPYSAPNLSGEEEGYRGGDSRCVYPCVAEMLPLFCRWNHERLRSACGFEFGKL